MRVPDHPFEPYPDSAPGVNNPRRPGACRHCWFREDLHPAPPPPDPPRDVRWELDFGREACRLAGVDGSSLLDFSQRRVHPGPVREFTTRDLRQDLAEELADAVNYATWEAHRAAVTGEHLERMQRSARVIGYMALAYAELMAD